MTAAESAGLVAPGRRERPRQRRQFQHPLLPAPPAHARARRCGRPRRRPARHRPLLPGLAAPRHGLELAPRAGQGRGAPGRRRHRLALAGPDGVRHRPADRGGHGRPRDLHRQPRHEPAGRSRRSRRSGPPTRSTRAIGTEDAATILLRFANGARGARGRLADQRRPEELAPVGDRRRRGARGLGLGDAGPPLAGPSRPAQRDPAPQPGPDGRCRSGGGGAAGRPRRGLRRHLRRPVPGDLRRRGGGRPDARPAVCHIRRRATTRCSSTTRSRGAPAIGRWVDVDRSPAAGSVGPTREPRRHGGPPDETRPADCAVPEHAADRRRRLDRGQRLRDRSRSPAGRATGGRPDVTRARRTSTWRTCRPAQASELVAEIAAEGPRASRASGYYPNPLHPDPAHREQVIGHLRHVITAAEQHGRPVRQHLHGRRRREDPGRRTGRRPSGSGRTSCRSPRTTGVRITIENCPMLFSHDEWPGGHNLATTPRIWRRILEQWGGTIGLNFDPSHLDPAR